MLQVIDHRLLGGDESAHRGQRLAERAHDDIDVVEHAQMFGRARAGIAQHADAVRFIHDRRARRRAWPRAGCRAGRRYRLPC